MNKQEKYDGKLEDILGGAKQVFYNIIVYLFRFYWLIDIVSFFIKKDKDALVRISEEKYKDLFINNRSMEELKFSYQQAWASKNFEIDLYWKRAQYFWAFQIAAFAGYFAVLNSGSYSAEPVRNPEVLFFVVCIGFITAIAWNFINQGSKTWQRHWEIHVDMLEEKITGPLYKVVTTNKTYSLSKINDIVSRFFVCIWLLIGIEFLTKNYTINPSLSGDVDWSIVGAIIITFYFLGAMYFGHGRGRFGNRKIELFERNKSHSSKNESQSSLEH